MNFDESSSDSEDERLAYMQRRAAKKPPVEVKSADYLYDEVYEQMKGPLRGAVGSGKSQYIGSLLAAKNTRDLERAAQREQRMRLQLEREKLVYGEKDSFESGSYRKYKEEQEKFLGDEQESLVGKVSETVSGVTADNSAVLTPSKGSSNGLISLDNLDSQLPGSTITSETLPTAPVADSGTDPLESRLQAFVKLWDETKLTPEELLQYTQRYKDRATRS